MKKWFKRYRICLSSRIENVLDQVENHEAVVAAAVKEAREHAARAKVKLNRVHRDGETLRQRAEQLATEAVRWEERATSCVETDRERARECLRRRTAAKEEQARLEREAAEHGRLEKQLTSDLRRVEERVRELQRRQHTLAAREQRAEAAVLTAPGEVALLDDIEDVFERWEGKLAESEIRADLDVDTFRDGFVETESNAELDAELDALIAEKKHADA
ncbi:PspA/IM30 family protein [Cerasicoccus maritimus]|uniref:PspA/IM30 family protein n=1 Tax=Cerasicoccus maritimus TaxID=490089 RepID=UPI0028525FCE|nr:PspA/IM30 family protein [Cerasicoccus maritimus]